MGAENRVTSRDLLIFVDQTAKATVPTYQSGITHPDRNLPFGRSSAQGAMRTTVIDVLGQDLFEMRPVDDKQPIQTLAATAAHPAFSDRVRPRHPNKTAQDVDADRGEYRIERGRELRVAVTDQKPQTVHSVAEFNQQVPGLLHQPLRSRTSRRSNTVST